MKNIWNEWDEANDAVEKWIIDPREFTYSRVVSDVMRLRSATLKCIEQLENELRKEMKRRSRMTYDDMG